MSNLSDHQSQAAEALVNKVLTPEFRLIDTDEAIRTCDQLLARFRDEVEILSYGRYFGYRTWIVKGRAWAQLGGFV